MIRNLELKQLFGFFYLHYKRFRKFFDDILTSRYRRY